MMLIVSFAAWMLTPRARGAPVHRAALAEVVPRSFGDWQEVATATDAIDPRGELETTRPDDSPYDDVLMRSYVNRRGETVLLALAYGRAQAQEAKIHRPELCYLAQGFEVLEHTKFHLPLERITIPGSRLLVASPDRVDLVSYWIRIGSLYGDDAWHARYYIFVEGLKGRVLDGILVRVSQTVVSRDAASAELYRFQETFLADLVTALPGDLRKLLVGKDIADAL